MVSLSKVALVAVAAAPSVLAVTYTSLGCYSDQGSPRSLNSWSGSSGTMTQEECQTVCTKNGYTYSGTEYAAECYCSNTLGGAPIASSSCNMACVGNSAEMCGGPFALNVFKAGTGSSTPTTTSSAPSSSPTGYLGCYVDQGTPRSLSSYSTASASMTNTLCTSTCSGLGYAYAGTEYASECYCGNTISGALAGNDADCNAACVGDGSKKCGGSFRLSVYKTGNAGTTTTSSAAPPTGTGTGAVYSVSDTFIGPSFLTGFTHQAIGDPTYGRVNYVDQKTALAQNLTFTSSDTLIMRADYKTVLSPSGPGRNTIRIQSVKQWSTAVTVLDVRHMPQGCGTWPAFWTTSSTVPWPEAGEIDIVEGVNDEGPNVSTLHTNAGCTQNAANLRQTGTLKTTNCDWHANGNAGCGSTADKPNNYGPALNAVGGGWYVMERTNTYISIWFWARNDATVPASVKNGASTVDTRTFGTPYANFVNNSCNFNTFFGPEAIIINLTLCGAWAGAVYPSTCPKTCLDHVNQDPQDFANAYWDIASVRVYS